MVGNSSLLSPEHLDFVKIMCIVLGSCGHIHKEIDSCYEKRRSDYYKAYRNSSYYNDALFLSITTEHMEKSKKVAGIILWELENGKEEITLRLIKKAYKYTYTYVIQRQKRKNIDIQDYVEKLVKKLESPIFLNADMTTVAYHFAVCFFLCSHLKIQYDYTAPPIQQMLQSFHSMTSFNGKLPDLKHTYEKYKHQITNDKRLFLIPEKESLLLSELIDTHILSLMDNEMDFSENMTETLAHFLTSPFYKCAYAYGLFFTSLGFNVRDFLSSIEISEDTINSIFSLWYFMRDLQQFDESEKGLFIISCFHMYAFTQEYQQTRRKYLEQIKDSFFYELDSIQENVSLQQKEFSEKKQEFFRQQREFNQEKKQLMAMINELERELSTYRKKVQELVQQNELLESNKKELHSLRESIFSLQQNVESQNYAPKSSREEMLSFLKGKECVVVGGHPSWQNHLKAELPNFIFISVDEIGRDFSFIHSVDMVFIQTKYISHTLYNRVMKSISKNEVPLRYINGITNIDLTVQYMFMHLYPDKFS